MTIEAVIPHGRLYTCLSTDAKPVGWAPGLKMTELDTGDEYMSFASGWRRVVKGLPEGGSSSNYLRADGSYGAAPGHPDAAAHASLDLVLGGSVPGGELGGSYATPTVNATHAGSAHHPAFVQADHDALPNPHHSNANDHAASHTLASHSARAHSDLTGIGATDHHSNALDHAVESGESTTHTHAAGGHPDLAAHDTLGLTTQAELDTHAAAADPHAGYQRESEKGAASGYASLDAGGTVPDAQIPAAIARDSELHAQAHTPESHTSQTATAAQLNELVGGAQTTLHGHAGGASAWTTKVKTADQTNNTTTLADDAILQFNTVANTQYTVRLLAFLLTNATADSKYRLVHTGTTTRVRRRVKRTATSDIAQTIELKTAFDSADVVLSTTGVNPWVEENIILQVGASGGVLKFQFAQVTANAGPTQCLEGSYLEHAAA